MQSSFHGTGISIIQKTTYHGFLPGASNTWKGRHSWCHYFHSLTPHESCLNFSTRKNMSKLQWYIVQGQIEGKGLAAESYEITGNRTGEKPANFLGCSTCHYSSSATLLRACWHSSNDQAWYGIIKQVTEFLNPGHDLHVTAILLQRQNIFRAHGQLIIVRINSLSYLEVYIRGFQEAI